MDNILLELIKDLSNSGAKITFEEDWGQNTLTISIEHEKISTHTHIGYPGCDFEDLTKGTVGALGGFLRYIKDLDDKN